MARVPVDHSFVLDTLMDSRVAPNVCVNPMFGCHAVYVGERIVLMLRHRESSLRDNGVWVVVQPESRDSVRKQFPVLRPIELFENMKEGGPTWLCLGEDTDEFEETSLEIAELIIQGDSRFGKVPQSAKRSARKPASSVTKKKSKKNSKKKLSRRKP